MMTLMPEDIQYRATIQPQSETCKRLTWAASRPEGVCPCRMYEQLKQQQEAEAARKEEEDRLIDLLRAEEEAERLRLKSEAQRRQQEQVKLDLQRANEEQKRMRVSTSLALPVEQLPRLMVLQ